MAERTCKTYEEVATVLLNDIAGELGLETVEDGRRLVGRHSGTTWTIDATGVSQSNGELVLIECKRYTTSRVKQEQVAGLAYRIQDTGAAGGIIVSPMDLQEGAALVAAAEGIVHVKLDAAATTSDYIMEFLGRSRIGATTRLDANARLSFEADVCRRSTS